MPQLEMQTQEAANSRRAIRWVITAGVRDEIRERLGVRVRRRAT